MCGLVLVEQLYRNTRREHLWAVKFLCFGVGGMFAYDLFMYSEGLLLGNVNIELWAARGAIHVILVPTLALAAVRNPEWSVDVFVSRHVVFHTVGVFGAGVYLMGMAAAGYYIRLYGGTWGGVAQAVFLFGALLLLMTLMSSEQIRSRTRVFLSKHFFRNRYDYREEWLNFTQTLSTQDPELDMRTNILRAIAGIVESPGGVMWVRQASGQLRAASQWRADAPHGSVTAPSSSLVRFLERRGWVVLLDDYQQATEQYEDLEMPAWLLAMRRAWLIVPLMHGEELVAFIVFTRSGTKPNLNWEDIDLLKTVGRQAGGYLALLSTTEALSEARQFEAFNRLSAFVVHDLKNRAAIPTATITMAMVGPDRRADARLSRWWHRALVAVVVSAGVWSESNAGEWRVTPRVSARQTYSDNINLDPSGFERHDFITSVSPGIAARGRGGRINLDLAYDLQVLDYARNSSPRRQSHRLQAGAQAEVIEQILSVDFRSTAGQQSTDNTTALAQDPTAGVDNTSQFFTYSINPVARHRLGSYADIIVSTGFSQVINERSVNSDARTLNIAVDSGARFQRLGWQLGYNQRAISNSTNSTTDFRSANAGVSYRFNRKWSAFVSGGAEFNDFQTSRSTTDAITWRLGGTWTPTSRTNITTSYNRRFFSDSISMALQHRARRTVITASFDETATTTTTLQLEQVLVPFVDEFGEEVVDPGTGEPLIVAIDTATPTDEVIILRRFAGSIAWQGQRTNASLSISEQIRDFELSGDTERVFAVSAGVSRRLSRKARGRVGAQWQTTEFRGSSRADSRWSVNLPLTRQIYRRVSGGVELRHIRNSSDRPDREFSESRAGAFLSMVF